MNYIKQNIKYLRETVNLNQKDFGDLFGYNRDNIASYERGTEPKIDFIQKIVNYFHITIEDFINNEVSSVNSENDTTKGTSDINEINSTSTKEFLLRSDTRRDKQEVPLYDLNTAASLITLFEGHQNIIGHIKIPNLPKSDGAMYVSGDSMYPLLKSGDIVVFKMINDMTEGIVYGEIHILSVIIDGDLTTLVKFIKKSEKGANYINLVSQNVHHAARDIHMNKVKAIALVKASVRLNGMM